LFSETGQTKGAFIWGSGRPRLRLDILKRSAAHGGAALPDFELYFLATQLAHIKPWISTNPRCPSTIILAATTLMYVSIIVLRRLEPVFLLFHMILQMILRSPPSSASRPDHPLIHLGQKMWFCSQHICTFQAKYPDTPIWENLSVREFIHIEATRPWTSKGIQLIKDIFIDNTLKPFETLKQELGVPEMSWLMYRQ
ncbi:hypothetical protein XELAEV_18023316mg, partial [Xenopus laevis]